MISDLLCQKNEVTPKKPTHIIVSKSEKEAMLEIQKPNSKEMKRDYIFDAPKKVKAIPSPRYIKGAI